MYLEGKIKTSLSIEVDGSHPEDLGVSDRKLPSPGMHTSLNQNPYQSRAVRDACDSKERISGPCWHELIIVQCFNLGELVTTRP